MIESARADRFKDSVGQNPVTGAEISKGGADLRSNLRGADLDIESRQQVQAGLPAAGILNQVGADFNAGPELIAAGYGFNRQTRGERSLQVG